MTTKLIVTTVLFLAAACGGDSNTPQDGGADTSTTTGDSALPDVASDASVTPTASTWMGTNVASDLSRVDITYQLTQFDTPTAQKDANGYPIAGVAGTSNTDIGFVLPTGTYNVSYTGTGTLNISGIGKLVGSWQSVSGEQRAQIAVTGTPGSFGNFLTLGIANAPGQTVTNLHVYFPGIAYDTTQTFLPQFLGLLKPFRALRFMEWQAINNSKLTNWSDRPTSAHFGQSSFGEPYEHIAELVNETGKDCWINIPELATDAFIHSFAQLMLAQLDFTRIDAARQAQGLTTPFELILENSNETWNNSFSAYATFLALANANTTRYTGTYSGTYGPSWMATSSDLMKVGQYEADRLANIAAIFRQEFGAKANVISPVLSGWALGAAYSDDGLEFLKANYGTPSTIITRIAMAPYFGPDDAQTAALPTLFTSADANVQAMDATFMDFAKLVAAESVKITAYEGGQGISGNTNLTIKHLAQHDERMYESYTKYFALWQKDFGQALFMHFDLAGTPGLPENIYQYGFWGSIISALEDPAMCSPNLPTLTGTESVSSVVHHCPKYRALAEQAP